MQLNSNGINLNYSPFSPPLGIIKQYLNVSIDAVHKYLYPTVKNNICYLRVDKKSGVGNEDKEQITICQKLIAMLKGNGILISLNQLELKYSKEYSEINLDPERVEAFKKEDTFSLYLEDQKAQTKADIITGIFLENISFKNKYEELFHRTLLAAALEWHVQTHFLDQASESISQEISKNKNTPDPESKFFFDQVKTWKSAEILRLGPSVNENKPRSKSSNNRKSYEKLSFHKKTEEKIPLNTEVSAISLSSILQNSSSSDLEISPRLSPPRKLISKSKAGSMERNKAFLKMVSLACLYNCRLHWIYAHKKTVTEISWDEKEYSLIDELRILKMPMMHFIIQEELVRDINAFSTDITLDHNLQGIMHDIHRNLKYWGKDLISRLPTILKNKEGISDYVREVNAFYYLLEDILRDLKCNTEEKNKILTLWNSCVEEELKDEISTDSFVFAGENFLRRLNRNDRASNKIFTLIGLLRQNNYKHPISVMQEIIKYIPLDPDYEDPKRMMEYRCLQNGKMQYIATLRYFPSSKEASWSNNQVKVMGFDIEIKNTITSLDTLLNSWDSEIEIKVNISSAHSKKLIVPDDIQKNVIDPLQAVGFKLEVFFLKKNTTQLASTFL